MKSLGEEKWPLGEEEDMVFVDMGWFKVCVAELPNSNNHKPAPHIRIPLYRTDAQASTWSMNSHRWSKPLPCQRKDDEWAE